MLSPGDTGSNDDLAGRIFAYIPEVLAAQYSSGWFAGPHRQRLSLIN